MADLGLVPENFARRRTCFVFRSASQRAAGIVLGVGFGVVVSLDWAKVAGIPLELGMGTGLSLELADVADAARAALDQKMAEGQKAKGRKTEGRKTEGVK